MHRRPEYLDGLRKELREFMRSCEALLSVISTEALTDDEVDIVRYYAHCLNEKYVR